MLWKDDRPTLIVSIADGHRLDGRNCRTEPSQHTSLLHETPCVDEAKIIDLTNGVFRGWLIPKPQEACSLATRNFCPCYLGIAANRALGKSQRVKPGNNSAANREAGYADGFVG